MSVKRKRKERKKRDREDRDFLQKLTKETKVLTGLGFGLAAKGRKEGDWQGSAKRASFCAKSICVLKELIAASRVDS
jgi:hypothetical protein